MVEQWAPPSASAEEEDPPLFLTIRNTHNLAHAWNESGDAGEAGAGEAGERRLWYRHAPPAPDAATKYWEIAVELRTASVTGKLANDRINSVAYELHPTFDPRRVRVTSEPFCIRRQGWDEFQVGVSLQLVDADGFPRTLELEHDLRLDKDVAFTVYKIEESRFAHGSPFTFAKIESSSEVVTEEKLPALAIVDVKDLGAAGSVQPRRAASLCDNGDTRSQCATLARVPESAIVQQLGELGRGSFGLVLKASTTGEAGLPANVACKQLFQRDGNESAFWLEAKVVASLPTHRNVIKLFGWCEAFGKPSLIFELCEEGDLSSYLKRHANSARVQALPPATILDLSRQIAAGMSHVHANRLYHRDLKPNNVLLTRSGVVGPSGLRAVVTDLGLAKNVEAEIHLSQSVQGSQVGTYIYMAPETIAKSVFSQGTDVWSYAAIVWELLTGRAPYSYLGEVNPVAVAFQVGFGSLAPEPLEWPAPFGTILSRAFLKDHHQRPSFKEILHEIDTASQGFGGVAPAEFAAQQKRWIGQLRERYGTSAGSVRASRPAPMSALGRASKGPVMGSPAFSPPVLGSPNFDSPLATPTFETPVSDVGTPDFGMGMPTWSVDTKTVVGSMKLSPALVADVASVVGGGCDYTAILLEYGFDSLEDFEIYSEAELIQMGFKKVHARKLLRASTALVANSAMPSASAVHAPQMIAVGSH